MDSLGYLWKVASPNSLYAHLSGSHVLFKASVLLGYVQIIFTWGKKNKIKSSDSLHVFISICMVEKKVTNVYSCIKPQYGWGCLPYRKLCTKGMSASWRTTMSAASGMWQAQEAWTCSFLLLVWLFLRRIPWPWTSLASKLLKFLVAMTWTRVERNRANASRRYLDTRFPMITSHPKGTSRRSLNIVLQSYVKDTIVFFCLFVF